MLVVVNPTAGGGTAVAKWCRIGPEVRRRLGSCEVAITDPAHAGSAIEQALTRGELDFVAAGGDGTVNLVASRLLKHSDGNAPGCVRLGAVGLGSSNDFHKPLQRTRTILGIPCKIDFQGAEPWDVGDLVYEDETGRTGHRSWLVNASIGITAEANHLFNHPNSVLRLLKRVSVDMAISYAALHTIWRFRGHEVAIQIDGEGPIRTSVKNVGVVKNPHFGGSLRYDSPYEPQSSDFYVHLMKAVALPRLLWVVAHLLRGEFMGRKGTLSSRARRVAISADRPFAVECDGEVVTAVRALFTLLPRRLSICR
ncbi:MAG: diacylglycerol/lipid kinase family protein [Gemmatimonadales bacterium]